MVFREEFLEVSKKILGSKGPDASLADRWIELAEANVGVGEAGTR